MLPLLKQRMEMCTEAPYLKLKHAFKDRCVWEGTVEPSGLSERYVVRITYRLGYDPQVRVLNPPLVRRADRPIPHFNGDGTLCLYPVDSGEWTAADSIAYTIVPWISDWLFHYEVWMATGVWHGDEPKPT
ncbi:MAG: hypothetical protein NTW87_11560 [Planctomycetota bacterium]|nr:hypothetical protein [Planctomycetota bacterium]